MAERKIVPIPPPTAEVKVHGDGSWTVEIGWIDPSDGLPWPLIGVIYDDDHDARHPDYDPVFPDAKPDPKLVIWNRDGDVVEGALELALTSIEGIPDLFTRLTTTETTP